MAQRPETARTVRAKEEEPVALIRGHRNLVEGLGLQKGVGWARKFHLQCKGQQFPSRQV